MHPSFKQDRGRSAAPRSRADHTQATYASQETATLPQAIEDTRKSGARVALSHVCALREWPKSARFSASSRDVSFWSANFGKSLEQTMSRMGILACALAGQALVAGSPLAQDAPAVNERFSLYRTEDGYLRLDGRTGQLSSCIRRQSRWLCQTMPEERTALEIEIGRLQADNAALKKALLAHQLALPQGVQSDPADAAQPRGKADGELAQVRGAIESVWRRLVAFVISMQRDLLKRS